MQFLREPLIHFVGLGALVFTLHRVVAEQPTANTGGELAIKVDGERRSELNALFEQRQGHAPSPAESRALVDRWVEDELLFREALRIDLVRQDVGLRDQLIARMRGLLQASAGARVPSDEDLRRYFERHRASYRQPAVVTFTEYLIHPGSTAEDSARQLKEQLRAGQADAALPTRYERISWPQLEATFGVAFKQRLETVPLQDWQILRSNRGLHVIKLEARQSAVEPDFVALHDRLASDLRVAEVQEHFKQELDRLRVHFDVSQDGAQ